MGKLSRHIMFTDDDDATATPLLPVAHQQNSPLKASSSTSTSVHLKRNHGVLSNGVTHTKVAIKRPKVTNFRESDNEEEEGIHSVVSGPSFARDGSVRSVATGQNNKKEARIKLRNEAARLETGRKQLPIWEGKDAILEAIKKNDTVVILGETGSGKTTQVPQFILLSDVPVAQPRVCVTQPRRVAATTLATRVSAEAASELGERVGYTVRFDDRSGPSTRLKFVTDGTLLAEMLSDRDMENYDVIVLDEAHERSLRTDMLMGFLKDIQVRRKQKVKAWLKESKSDKGKEREREMKSGDREPSELKIVVMSATLDAKKFSDFFNNAPVLYVKGRQHKVKVLYANEPQDDYCDAALKTIFQIHLRQPPGDILVFLPGQEDIDGLAAAIKSYLPDLHKSYAIRGEILVCPLYARLPASEQAKAFAFTPPKTRKVILSTNIAETSVTIPGIKFVIDSGMVKEKEYHSSVGIDTLVVEHISRSSAQQRTGRAGRESDGICYRLYTEESFAGLAVSTKPEIQRVSLTFTILHLLASGQEDVWSFQYMDRPEKSSIEHALLTLRGLGALDQKGVITGTGKTMANLPLDPVYAKVLLSSFSEGCPSDIIDLVSLLSAKDSLLINTTATRELAQLARKKFHHRTGDHMMLLNILRAYEELPKEERKVWCRENYVNFRAMMEVFEARKQLRERCERLNLDWQVSCGEEDEPVLGSIVAGLFGNIALRQDDGTYRHSITRQPVAIHPGSIMHNNKKALAIVYDELVMTTKSYARGVSSIQLSWIRSKASSIFGEKVAEPQLKKKGQSSK